MSTETSLQTITAMVQNAIDTDKDIFLVDIKINQANDIKVYLDADDGITIDKCIKINRSLYKQIEEQNIFPGGNFSLEVSSPGVDEPLKLLRQYKKNIGRKVEITMLDDTKKEGKLSNVSEEEITIEDLQGKGKKAIVNKTNIFFNQIKHTKVLVTF